MGKIKSVSFLNNILCNNFMFLFGSFLSLFIPSSLKLWINIEILTFNMYFEDIESPISNLISKLMIKLLLNKCEINNLYEKIKMVNVNNII